jgi:hypothetical protein
MVQVMQQIRYTDRLPLRLMLEYAGVFAVAGLPLCCSRQSVWLLTQRSRVGFPALPDFLSINVSGTGSTQ